METTAGTTQYNTTITASNMASGNTGYQVVPDVWSSLEKGKRRRKKTHTHKKKEKRKKDLKQKGIIRSIWNVNC